MNLDLITKNDLEVFRVQLLDDIKKLLDSSTSTRTREWLKSAEVRKMLGVSEGKLRALREANQLVSTKVGSINYYRYADIVTMMSKQ